MSPVTLTFKPMTLKT